MKRFFSSVGFKILAGVAAVLVALMVYAATTDGTATIPAAIGGAILTPLQTAVSAVGDALSDGFGLFADSKALETENRRLKEELNELRDRLVDYDEMSSRYDELIRYLELKEQNPAYRFADARVIARDPADNYGNFTISAGSTSGISVGDPVITADGLIGVVSEVSLSWAQVSTVLDQNTHVSAYVSRTGDTGTTGGSVRLAQQGLLQLNYLERDAGVAEGDYIVTAGGNSQYPPKLRIGQVTQVTASSDGLSMTATVTPFADVMHASNVLIITDFGSVDKEADRETPSAPDTGDKTDAGR